MDSSMSAAQPWDLPGLITHHPVTTAPATTDIHSLLVRSFACSVTLATQYPLSISGPV